MTVDAEMLRAALRDYYGSAMFSGFPVAAMDISRVETASSEELIQMSREAGIDLSQLSLGDIDR